MNRAVFLMELRRNLKAFLIWTAAICGMLFFGMMFYPAINTGNILEQVQPLFDTPMLKGVLTVFGVDIASLGSLSGFYVTYNSFYNILLGCIFASVLAGNMLSREESEKTAEFLYTRPVSRLNIFVSKGAVMMLYIFLLAGVFFIISMISMEAVAAQAPRTLEISKRNHALVVKQIRKHPEELYKAFNIDEDSFAEYSMSFASDLLRNNSGELEDMNLSLEDMDSLIQEVSKSPEDFFETALSSPERYMDMFNFTGNQREEFLENVRNERLEYEKMKKQFFSSPDIFIEFFNQNPSTALSQFEKENGSMADAVRLLELPGDFEKSIFKSYSASKLFYFSLYIFLLFSAFAGLILLVSVISSRSRSILGPALGVVFGLYFLKSITGMASGFSDAAGIISYISPFSWIDTGIGRWDYAPQLWRLLLFSGTSVVAVTAAYLRFRRKDILV